MTRTSDEARESRALMALAKMRRDAAEQPTAEELERGLGALFARVTARRARRGRTRMVRWSLIGVAAAACIVVGIRLTSVVRNHSPTAEPTALAYEIEGGRVLEGGYLRESGSVGIKLLFNEGSRVTLTPGARGRVRSVEKQSAHVAIDQGVASFQVTPNPARQWWVEVGPFSVAVKGTVFTVAWDPASERFSLSLRTGRVVVSGPLMGGEITLRSGQRLMVNLPKAETLITEETEEQSAQDAASAAVPKVVEPPAAAPLVGADWRAGPDRRAGANAHVSAAPAAPTVAKVDAKRPWSEQLANGEWDRILADVQRAGLEATLDKASSEDLFALASAARYRRQTDMARAALQALRRRFPDSPRSLDALFLLGRVEEAHEAGKARAIDWYEDYLTRAATGAYAAEALGRKMILTNELRGRAEARPMAEEYLRRFPQGSYAGSARALCRVP